jgi:hypothetical protein
LLQVARGFRHTLLLLCLLASLLLAWLARSQLTNLFGRLGLLIPQLLKLLLRLCDTLLQVLWIRNALSILTEDTIRLVDGLHRLLLCLLLLLLSSGLFCRTQIVDGLLELLGSLSCLRIVLLAGQLIQLTLHLFQVTTQLRNLPLVVLRRLLFALLTLKFSLLAFRQFLQLVLDFLFLLGLLLLTLTALNRLVLVLVLIQFEFEQIGEIFGALRAATTTATTATSLLDLDLGVQGCGFAEVVIRFAFDRNRCRRVALHQVVGNRGHLLHGFVHVLGELLIILS